MYETIYSAVQAVDDLVWGWAMILLLLGTHIFMTIRTKGIQRKVFKGIKLSVTKDPEAEGEVSQFGALTTALAATIGTGNIIGVGNGHCPWRTWRCAVVLAHRCIWYCYKIQRGIDLCEISCKDKRRTYAGRGHVCSGERTSCKMAGTSFRDLRRPGFLRNRLCHAGKRHCFCM